MPSYSAEIQRALDDLLQRWNQTGDNLLTVPLATPYGTVYASVEVTIDRRSKALGLWDLVIYPEIADAVPRGKISGLLRQFLRDMLIMAGRNGFVDVTITGVRALNSSSARPGHVITMHFIRGRRKK